MTKTYMQTMQTMIVSRTTTMISPAAIPPTPTIAVKKTLLKEVWLILFLLTEIKYIIILPPTLIPWWLCWYNNGSTDIAHSLYCTSWHSKVVIRVWVEINNCSRAGVFPRYSNGNSICSIRTNSPVGDGVVSDEASSLWATEWSPWHPDSCSIQSSGTNISRMD